MYSTVIGITWLLCKRH